MNAFLEDDELARLTGGKLKSMQIAWRCKSGLRFWINATGHPVVPRSATPEAPTPSKEEPWVPRVLQERKANNTPWAP